MSKRFRAATRHRTAVATPITSPVKPSSDIILFNKPYNVLTQFTDQHQRPTLKDFIPIKNIYAAGRLDKDSEGLLILTNDGQLQHRLTDPMHKIPKTYWVQVEGIPEQQALRQLSHGVQLKDGVTRPAIVNIIKPPTLWAREPPIRQRKNQPTSWLTLTISEGKNRQVRRMTAAVGHPTLRLIRYSIGQWNIDGIESGKFNRLPATKIITGL